MTLDTGFKEITEERANYSGNQFWYCEIALTGMCNFSCHYCNKFKAEIDVELVKKFIEKQTNLKHIQLTGGEPTKSLYLLDLCKFIKSKNIKLGISTNGSASLEVYESLNADMFSISLDDYDKSTLLSRGYKDVDMIIENIKRLSKKTYVNIGLVIDSINSSRISKIIQFILNLGVTDIKLSVNTHDNVLPVFDDDDYSKYPILNYRVTRFRNGKNMRGLSKEDTFKCELVKNDISIVGNKHYPCLVYARENGDAIGELDGDILGERIRWYKKHSPILDRICRKFCMDFKCDFNRFCSQK